MIFLAKSLVRSSRSKAIIFSVGRRLATTDYQSTLSQIFRQIENGTLSAVEAEKHIQDLKYPEETLESKAPGDTLASFANLDHSRSKRTGFPEAIFAAGKTPLQVAAILDDMAGHVNALLESSSKDVDTCHKAILATR